MLVQTGSAWESRLFEQRVVFYNLLRHRRLEIRFGYMVSVQSNGDNEVAIVPGEITNWSVDHVEKRVE